MVAQRVIALVVGCVGLALGGIGFAGSSDSRPVSGPDWVAERPALEELAGERGETVRSRSSMRSLLVRTRSGDRLGFASDQYEVGAGDTVRVRVVNRSTHPHNVLVLRDSAVLESVRRAAERAARTDFVPGEMVGEEILGYAPLTAPMTRSAGRFVAPAPGHYPIVCTFPGHADAIRAQLVVSE